MKNDGFLRHKGTYKSMNATGAQYRFETNDDGTWTIKEWATYYWLNYQCEYETYEDAYIALRYIRDLESLYNYPRTDAPPRPS